MPRNSKVSCTSTICTITCATGHRFPDGSSITNLNCKNGDWVPARPEQSAVPDCQRKKQFKIKKAQIIVNFFTAATCTPPCQNGGVCLSYNVCQCPQDFRGKQCQYNVDVCSPKKLNFNGAFNCSGDNEALRCVCTCPHGVKFDGPVAPFYTCQYSKGHFDFQPPTCNFCK